MITAIFVPNFEILKFLIAFSLFLFHFLFQIASENRRACTAYEMCFFFFHFSFFLVASENRREKSLALLTQNFVKLFVCSNVSQLAR